jgi:hypothetical protein
MATIADTQSAGTTKYPDPRSIHDALAVAARPARAAVMHVAARVDVSAVARLWRRDRAVDPHRPTHRSQLPLHPPALPPEQSPERTIHQIARTRNPFQDGRHFARVSRADCLLDEVVNAMPPSTAIAEPTTKSPARDARKIWIRIVEGAAGHRCSGWRSSAARHAPRAASVCPGAAPASASWAVALACPV